MKIVLWGINGKMGRTVASMIATQPDLELLAGVDVVADPASRIYSDPTALPEGADVVIDFSRTGSLDAILQYATRNGCAVVLCTTGYTDEEFDRIDRAAQRIAILQSGNMSIGINLMTELVERVAGALGADYDVEIVEAHHNKKVDSPSGTAKMLVQATQDGRKELDTVVYGRHGADTLRSAHEIGVHSIRGGTVIGEHTVIFAGQDEILEIRHTALSRAIFASGALKAARTLVTLPHGRYRMKDILKG